MQIWGDFYFNQADVIAWLLFKFAYFHNSTLATMLQGFFYDCVVGFL